MIDCRRVGRTESGSCLGLRGPWRGGGAPASAVCCPRPQRWYSAGMKCICCTPAGGWVCCYGTEGAPEAADRLPPFKRGGWEGLPAALRLWPAGSGRVAAPPAACASAAAASPGKGCARGLRGRCMGVAGGRAKGVAPLGGHCSCWGC